MAGLILYLYHDRVNDLFVLTRESNKEKVIDLYFDGEAGPELVGQLKLEVVEGVVSPSILNEVFTFAE